MADIFESLLGEDPGDQAAIIAQLRRQNMLGQMAQLSGDRVLSPIGRQQVAGAQETAMQLGNQRSRKQMREDEQAFRAAQIAQNQADRAQAFQFQQDQAKANEQFRRDQLAQTAADREAQRGVTLAAAQEAADARRASTTLAGEKAARELRGELNKATGTGALVAEAYNILNSPQAPGTSLPTRMLRGTVEALGGATEGSESLAKLQSIGSLLVQSAPKLGGAMSDRDVLLYQEAAGKLSDPSVPNRAKKAALETLHGVIERNRTHLDTELGALTGEPTQQQQNQDWMDQFKVLPAGQ